MSTKTAQKNIISLIQALTTMFTDFLQDQAATASKGKVKIDDIIEAFKSDEITTKLTEIITANIPKAKRSVEKKLKDPDAPKRPKSSYLFFCDENRAAVKEANPELKMAQISSKLGEMWKALSEKKKSKFVAKAEAAKAEYKEASEHYERPSDEELAKLDVNKRRRGSKGESKTKRKRDPNAPKKPMTAFLYFSQEKRAEVKEANPEMKVTDIAKELGRMWKEDFADEKSRKKWIKSAEKDKARYNEEMAEYTPPAKEDDEESAPKAKKSKSKKSKPESDDDESPKTTSKKSKSKSKSKSKEPEVDSDSEEESPKKSKGKSKGKTKEVEPEVDNDDAEEDAPKPVAKKAKTKVEITMGTAKKVATPAKGKSKPSAEELTEADLFGDDD